MGGGGGVMGGGGGVMGGVMGGESASHVALLKPFHVYIKSRKLGNLGVARRRQALRGFKIISFIEKG